MSTVIEKQEIEINTRTPEGCKAIREHIKYSIEDMSLLIGFTEQTLSNFENGKKVRNVNAIRSGYYNAWADTLSSPYEFVYDMLMRDFPEIESSDKFKKIKKEIWDHGFDILFDILDDVGEQKHE